MTSLVTGTVSSFVIARFRGGRIPCGDGCGGGGASGCVRVAVILWCWFCVCLLLRFSINAHSALA